MEHQEKKQENSHLAVVYSAKRKIKNRSTRFHLSLYSAQIRKNTKIPSIPIIYEGKNGKNDKKEVKREVNGAKKKKKENVRHFHTVRKFCRCEIFSPFCKPLDFPAFSDLISFCL